MAGTRASAAIAAAAASTPPIANSERRSGCKANKTMSRIECVTYPPETKSPATIPAIVVATPAATATQNGPASSGRRAREEGHAEQDAQPQRPRDEVEAVDPIGLAQQRADRERQAGSRSPRCTRTAATIRNVALHAHLDPPSDARARTAGNGS